MADAPKTDSTAPFRLMDLPNELIRAICFDDGLKGKDLKSLRLVNKHISEFASDSFAEFYLESFTVVMTRSSIQAFIDISRHPRFSRYVHTVNISPVYAFSEGLAALVRNLTPVLMQTDQKKEKCEPGPKEVCFYTNRYFAEKRLSDRDAEWMLGAAFAVLAKRDQHLGLAFDVGESNPVGAKGYLYHRYSNEFGNDDRIWALSWKETIHTTIKAIHQQGCNINGLSIEGVQLGSYRWKSTLCPDEIEAELATVCRQLESITINFDFGDIKATLFCARRILSAATNLKHINLGAVSDDFHSLTKYQVLDCIPSPSIESVSLLAFAINQLDLMRFLAKHQAAIRGITLRNCRLQGSWESLAVWVRDHLPKLDHLEMDGVWDRLDDVAGWVQRGPLIKIVPGEDMKARINEILKDGRQKEIKEAEANKDAGAREEVRCCSRAF
ncbi:hypothetical protein D6D10_03235 [Aureobasidium pullulans]|uniref:F-box domain-containing protein n=1 Tax=Aureobasidium pullulans TaxID=5580 RepID=A0A4S9F081_AURPU|nr:hypothetical protein D6D10_03235 [Aureobasidium pullulans]